MDSSACEAAAPARQFPTSPLATPAPAPLSTHPPTPLPLQAGAPVAGPDAAKMLALRCADTLDSLMELTLGHLARRVAAPGQLEPAWQTLLAAFERYVLPVHRSKFTQFTVGKQGQTREGISWPGLWPL